MPVAVGLILLAAHNLSVPVLWFDEAGQYWMSRGLFHFSPLGAVDGSPIDGMAYGRDGFNLDPPGFTAVLYGWISAFGSEPGTLRSLPFALFLGAVASAAWFGARILRLPWGPVLALSAVFLSTSLSLRYAFELRAYSAELLAVVLTGGVTVAYALRPTARWLVTLAAVILTGSLATRYSYLFAAAAAAGTVIVLAALRKDRRILLQSVLPAAVLLACAGFLMWSGRLLQEGRGSAPFYTTGDLALKWFSRERLADLVKTNLISFPVVFLYAFLLVGVMVMLYARWRQRRLPTQGVSLPPAFLPLFIFIGAYSAFAFAGSVAGLTPWNVANKWSIGYTGVSVLAGLGLLLLAKQASTPGTRGASALSAALEASAWAAGLVGALVSWWAPRQWPAAVLAASAGFAVLLATAVARLALARPTSIGSRTLRLSKVVTVAAVGCLVALLAVTSMVRFTNFRYTNDSGPLDSLVVTASRSPAAPIRLRVASWLYPTITYLVSRSGLDSLPAVESLENLEGDDLAAHVDSPHLCDPSEVTVTLFSAPPAALRESLVSLGTKVASAAGCSFEAADYPGVLALTTTPKSK